MRYSIGIGITSACDLSCPQCYSREKERAFLPKEVIRELCGSSIEIESINLGTGESCLHPDFLEIIDIIHSHGIKVALTTNGLSVFRLPAEKIKYFNDIDFSLDFPTEEKNDAWRGRGSFDKVVNGIKKCRDAGTKTSIACCMTRHNYIHMDEMVTLSHKMSTNLRVNIYKPVNNDALKMTYDEFWKGISLLFMNSSIISCSEPVVNALLGIRPRLTGSPCGIKSFRITPRGHVVPCVYHRQSRLTVSDILHNGTKSLEGMIDDHEFGQVPGPCLECDVLDVCRGGCAVRRTYHGRHRPDEYCFKFKEQKPDIRFHLGESEDLVHSEYLCTIIVEGRC